MDDSRINFVVIEYEGEDSEYFNSAENVSQSFFLQVDARFEFNIEEIVENEQESVGGSVQLSPMTPILDYRGFP